MPTTEYKIRRPQRSGSVEYHMEVVEEPGQARFGKRWRMLGKRWRMLGKKKEDKEYSASDIGRTSKSCGRNNNLQIQDHRGYQAETSASAPSTPTPDTCATARQVSHSVSKPRSKSCAKKFVSSTNAGPRRLSEFATAVSKYAMDKEADDVSTDSNFSDYESSYLASTELRAMNVEAMLGNVSPMRLDAVEEEALPATKTFSKRGFLSTNVTKSGAELTREVSRREISTRSLSKHNLTKDPRKESNGFATQESKVGRIVSQHEIVTTESNFFESNRISMEICKPLPSRSALTVPHTISTSATSASSMWNLFSEESMRQLNLFSEETE